MEKKKLHRRGPITRLLARVVSPLLVVLAPLTQIVAKVWQSRLVRKILSLASSFGIIIFLVLLCTFFEAMTSDQVFSQKNIWTILGQTAINTIIAVGMTFVIISGGIDLSVGSIVALAGVISMAVMRHGIPLDYPFNEQLVGPVWSIGWAIAAALVASLFIGVAAGLHNGLPITLLRVPPFIATLGVMTAAKGFAFVYSGGSSIGQLPPQFTNLVNASHWFLPVVAVSVVACGSALLKYTSFGRSVYAIGGNEEAARLSGISVKGVKLKVYIICGVLAAVAGMLLSGRIGAGDPKSGGMFELNAIAAVVIGGTSLMGGVGTVFGTFLGALVIGVLEFGMVSMDISTFWQMVAKGYVILMAVILDQLKTRKR